MASYLDRRLGLEVGVVVSEKMGHRLGFDQGDRQVRGCMCSQ